MRGCSRTRNTGREPKLRSSGEASQIGLRMRGVGGGAGRMPQITRSARRAPHVRCGTRQSDSEGSRWRAEAPGSSAPAPRAGPARQPFGRNYLEHPRRAPTASISVLQQPTAIDRSAVHSGMLGLVLDPPAGLRARAARLGTPSMSPSLYGPSSQRLAAPGNRSGSPPGVSWSSDLPDQKPGTAPSTPIQTCVLSNDLR
jgi:hypothetical protein